MSNRVVAAGSNQATATLLTGTYSMVLLASGPDLNGVLLDDKVPVQVVVNACGQGVAVWPPPGQQIEAFKADTPVTIEDGNMSTFFFAGGGKWLVR